jgi:hypothetical protein
MHFQLKEQQHLAGDLYKRNQAQGRAVNGNIHKAECWSTQRGKGYRPAFYRPFGMPGPPSKELGPLYLLSILYLLPTGNGVPAVTS